MTLNVGQIALRPDVSNHSVIKAFDLAPDALHGVYEKRGRIIRDKHNFLGSSRDYHADRGDDLGAGNSQQGRSRFASCGL